MRVESSLARVLEAFHRCNTIQCEGVRGVGHASLNKWAVAWVEGRIFDPKLRSTERLRVLTFDGIEGNSAVKGSGVYMGWDNLTFHRFH